MEFNLNSPQHQPRRLSWCKGRIMASVKRCCESFCSKTSIHGFNHITAPRRHWIERLLWIFVTAMAVWGVVDISLGQWQRYNENPTVVTLEKDFRTWQFSMPGVTACEKNRANKDKLPNAIKSRWNVEPGHEKYGYYVNFINVVANSDLFHLGGYEEFKDDASLNVDLYNLTVDVMPENRVKMGSSEQMTNKWTATMSEIGACYTINSLAIFDIAITKPSDNDTESVPTTCKYSSQTCFYMFEGSFTIDYYIHSPYDIPDAMATPSTIFPSLNRFTELSATETQAGPDVRALAPRRRHCLYTDEPTGPFRRVYSTNTCRHDCRSRLAVKLCGCKPFYYFYTEGPLCTPAGMWCLSRHAHRLATFDGVKCSCYQQCVDSVFREISKEEQIWDRGPFQARGAVRFTVQAPRTRYTRYIVFHFQDLVVSFGGAAGLFLGASFISFVEIGYFLIERMLCIGRSSDKRVEVEVKKPTNSPYKTRLRELNILLEGHERRTAY